MIRVVLASHGNLAESMLQTGKMICGSDLMQSMDTIMIQEGDEGIASFEIECQQLAKQCQGQAILILTDLYGATPFNVCLSVFHDFEHRIVTGMNLAMIMEVAIFKDQLTLDELADRILQNGRQGIEKVSFQDHLCDDTMEDFL